MKPGLPSQPVTVDGVHYPSLSAAAKALKVSRDRLSMRVAALGPALSKEQLAIKIPSRLSTTGLGRPPTKSLPPSPLSWEFVYSRISSSPKPKSVGSSPAAYQSA